MTETDLLGQIALCYSPMIDRARNIIATRLTVMPLRAGAQLDVSQLLSEIDAVWREGAAKVSLNVLSEGLLNDLLHAQPSPNVMVEVPSFIASAPENAEPLRTLYERGTLLLLKGRPPSELPRDVLPCFKYSIIDMEEDRRLSGMAPPAGVAREIAYVQSGVCTLADMERSFERGAAAVLGWPMDDAMNRPGRDKRLHDLQVIIELMRRVDAEDPIEQLDATLGRDPTLAFKLMRYINSPVFGLSVEIKPFGHAIMMLGYRKLKRWLALLMTTAGKDPDLRPVMFATLRRGLLMEELARGNGDEELREELFVCGVFSLLDKMMGKPLDELLQHIPVPERVRLALTERGPVPAVLRIDVCRRNGLALRHPRGRRQAADERGRDEPRDSPSAVQRASTGVAGRNPGQGRRGDAA